MLYIERRTAPGGRTHRADPLNPALALFLRQQKWRKPEGLRHFLSLYFQNSKSQGDNRKQFKLYISQRIIVLPEKTAADPLDNFPRTLVFRTKPAMRGNSRLPSRIEYLAIKVAATLSLPANPALISETQVIAMDEEILKQIFDELLTSLEPLEAQNAALLQFLKDKGIATDEDLAPYLERAGNTSNVRWRAVRVRTAALISSAMKPADQPASPPAKDATPPQSTDQQKQTEAAKDTVDRESKAEKQPDQKAEQLEKAEKPDKAATGEAVSKQRTEPQSSSQEQSQSKEQPERSENKSEAKSEPSDKKPEKKQAA